MKLQVLKENTEDPAAGSVPAPVGESASADALLPWIFERFAGQRIVMTSQFGMEGCALIDMLAQHAKGLKVISIDTEFFFPETYQLRDRLIRKYKNIEFVGVTPELSPEQQALVHGDELWKRNPTQCCLMRKVEPLKRVMQDVDVWVTALRRSQSKTRANIKKVEWDWQYQVIKINPLAEWSRDEVYAYVKKNGVPYNPLHERGYPSIGCVQCTERVEGASATDYSRGGRWSAFEKTECGLHGDGI